MRGAFAKMRVGELREQISALGQRDAKCLSADECRGWLNDRGVTEWNIGDYCREILRIVVGKNPDGYNVGLSYVEMKRLVQQAYPHSKADEKHLRWYATSMRVAGEMIPVYRGKSRWR